MQPFEAVVAEHGAVVMRVCRALLGPVEADDAWSETFLAALRAYPGLPETARQERGLPHLPRSFHQHDTVPLSDGGAEIGIRGTGHVERRIDGHRAADGLGAVDDLMT